MDYQRSDELKIPQKTDGKWVFPRHWTSPQCAAWVLARGDAASAVTSNTPRDPQAVLDIAGPRVEADSVWSRNVESCPALTAVEAGGPWPKFVVDIAAKARRYPLSEKQAAAVTRFVEESRVEKKAVPAGRRTVEGRVVSLKWTERNSGYGYAARTASVLKALIQCDGYRLYGTVPSALVDSIAVGDTLRVEATVEATELGFGFWSRPRCLETERSAT